MCVCLCGCLCSFLGLSHASHWLLWYAMSVMEGLENVISCMTSEGRLMEVQTGVSVKECAWVWGVHEWGVCMSVGCVSVWYVSVSGIHVCQCDTCVSSWYVRIRVGCVQSFVAMIWLCTLTQRAFKRICKATSIPLVAQTDQCETWIITVDLQTLQSPAVGWSLQAQYPLLKAE